MNIDFDNLIRHSKPAVPEAARERVLGYVQAGGAEASHSAPFRMLARVAALVMLALGAGIASALVTQRSEPVDVVVDFSAQVNDLRTRIEAVDKAPDSDSSARQLEDLKAEVAALEAEQQRATRELLREALAEYEQERMEEWRERHVQYVRAHHKRQTDATIERLRADVGLTAEQEAEVRALLDDAGKEAEGLIGNFYGGRRHRSAHREFEKLAEATDTKLSALLSEQQREQVGSGLVSNRPEDWGPRNEFRDGTDYEVYMNWMNVSRE